MDTIFTVRNEDLERFSPQEAVDFFREILWAEASSLRIGKNLINVPSAITVADGGIDAEVQNVETSGGQGIIRPGLTRYQIKTGDFSLSKEGNIRAILFKEKAKELKARVKSCLDKQGTLVVVLFGWDDPETRDDLLINRFREKLGSVDQKYSKASIEICRQNNLIGYLKPFPSLALKANGRSDLRFQTHQSWSVQAEMKKAFKAGPAQEEFISNLQSELRRNSEAIHTRVWGEPGIGKTRLVLEATRGQDLEPLVIYCDAASKFRESDLMNEVIRDDNQFWTILVIDECDLDSRSYIWDKLKYRGPRIKLVSIYNEQDETSGNITYFSAPLLQKQQTVGIIEEYGIPRDGAERWAAICGGFPRVAHAIGQNLRANPEDLLKNPDTVLIWERQIAGGDKRDSQEVRERRLVLRHIALFKRFGYGKPFTSEARAIAMKVERASPQVTWPRFQEIVGTLRKRRILQGENTLYITPKALHIWLWVDWWETYGEGFSLQEFAAEVPDSLMDGFCEMFKYAAESPISAKKVKELLEPGGFLEKEDSLKTDVGSSFFLALAEADPKSALAFLKRTVGVWGKEELLQFTTGRREVVWALEMIAMWRDLFADSARLLLALGEAENETVSNNASGVFAELFSPARGRVAPTEASPEERFPILQEALTSSSRGRRLLALRACDKALTSQNFVRDVGAEYQGLRPEPRLWTPKTYGEIFDAYRRVWELVKVRLDALEADEQQTGVNVLLNHVRGLGRIGSLTEMVMNTLDELAEKPYVYKKTLLARIVELLHYNGKGLSPQTRQRWEQLRDKVTGSDFSSLLHRYAGMVLLEDRYDEQGNRVDQMKPRIQELAAKALKRLDLLRQELDWLVTAEAENGYPFGYEIGRRDKDFSLLPTLLEAQRKETQKGSAYFTGGYFRALYERDNDQWEKQLDTLAQDEEMAYLVPELTWRSGMSDKAALRILALAEKVVISPREFETFRYGSVILELSEDVFKKWINFLLNCEEIYAASIPLALYHDYYLRQERTRSLPEELTLKLLTHESLFKKTDRGARDHLDDYLWTEIGKAFVCAYPRRSLQVADKMLEHFGEEGTVFEGFHSETQSVLNEISRKYPNEVWVAVSKRLGPPIDSRAFDIRQWLRGGEFYETGGAGALPFFPPAKIWEWVDENIEKRAWYVANFVPKQLFHQEGKVCLAREVLVRYGQRKDVRSNLIANFSTEGWTGSASLHLQNKKQELLDFRKTEDNENVKLLIDEFVIILDSDIEREKIEEERRGF